MKYFLLSFLLFLGSCASTTSEALPPVEFEDGFSFEIPCNVHNDAHVHSVVHSEVVRVYMMAIDQKPVGYATAEQIREVLEIVKRQMNGPQKSGQ